MIQEDEISAGITGFIDILGFGNKVLNSNTLEDINSVANEIKKVQEEFEYNDPERDAMDSDLPRKTVLAFSDCVVINIPLESESTVYTGTFDGYMFEFVRIALAQIRCIQQSIFLRGGIDSGWWYNTEHIVISQSLTQAYKVEGSADVPVIALSKDLYDKFENHPDKKEFYGENSGVLESMFELYDSGDNTFHFINYLEIVLQNINWQTDAEQRKKFDVAATAEEKDRIRNQGYQKNAGHCLKVHSSQIELAFKNAKSEKVKNKYRWLSIYHNKIAKQWSDDEDLICEI